MRKIILINVFMMLTLAAFCQEAKTSNTKVPKELMINGIPYSQYKARLEELKQTGTEQRVNSNLNSTPVETGKLPPIAPVITIPTPPLKHETVKDKD